MFVYADLVILLNFLVDLLLLLGTNRLTGHPLQPGRAAIASAVGAVYSGACLVSSLRFLGGTFWRIVSLGAMSSIAFGWNRGTLRRTAAFVLLSMALGGLALGLGRGNFWALLASSGGLYLLCAVGLKGLTGSAKYAVAELRYGTCRRTLTALRDTGNLLKDPVTGQPVLVAGADTAWEMMGLTRQQLEDPILTMTQSGIPGLRLIPYRSVGRASGMLLGVQMDEVRLDGKKVAHIVAFAPETFRGDGCQALTGGQV